MIDLPKKEYLIEQLPLTTNLLSTFQQGSGIKVLFYPIQMGIMSLPKDWE